MGANAHRNDREGEETLMADRPMAWTDTTVDNDTVAANATDTRDLSADLSIADKRGCTVVRILVRVTMRPALIDTGQLLTYGITMSHEDVADQPDPHTAADQPGWLLRDHCRVIMSDLEDGSQIQTRAYDLRASRKFRGPSQRLMWIIRNNAGGGTAVQYDLLARVCCMMG